MQHNLLLLCLSLPQQHVCLCGILREGFGILN